MEGDDVEAMKADHADPDDRFHTNSRRKCIKRRRLKPATEATPATVQAPTAGQTNGKEQDETVVDAEFEEVDKEK